MFMKEKSLQNNPIILYIYIYDTLQEKQVHKQLDLSSLVYILLFS